MKLRRAFVTQNPCFQANLAQADARYRLFRAVGPRGLMLHSVGCAQPSAEVFARCWNRADCEVCVHAVVDGNTGEVWQTLPWDFRGWHAGGSANDTHIGVELCEPACLTYGAGGFTVGDLAAARACAARTYQAAVALFARLCERYDLDPLEDICSHAEGARQGIASQHGDPEHLWKGLGLDYTMDGFRRDVKKALCRTQDLWIERLSDVPYAGVRSEVRTLLDCGAIDGGTPAEVDPDDVGLPWTTLRALVMAKRYADQRG